MFKRIFIFILAVSMFGCGGGGTGGSTNPVVYIGNENQARLTTANADTFVAAIMGDEDVLSAPTVSGKPRSGANSTLSQRGAASPPGIIRGLMHSGTARSLLARKATDRRAISETHPCPNGGEIAYSGSIDERYYTGTIRMDYRNCRIGGATYNGDITDEVRAFNRSYSIPEDETFTFGSLTFQNADYDYTMSGTLAHTIDIRANSENLTFNMTAHDNKADRFMKFVNFSNGIVYDNGFNPTTGSSTMSGRIYDSIEGYADFSSKTAVRFKAMSQDYPDSGGPVLFAGAEGTGVAVTPRSSSHFVLEADTNGDGIYDTYAVREWTELGSHQGNGANVAPLADAGQSRTVGYGTVVALDGSNSSDSNGDSLTVTWEIVSKPQGSTAALSDPHGVKPEFIADLNGDYVIRLVVNDGTADSEAKTITITAVNYAPTASAGDDQNAQIRITVNLDGSASTANDTDRLTYSWSFISRPNGSAATLSGADTPTASFVPDVSGIYWVKLVVSDGESESSDTVKINAVNRAPTANAGGNQNIDVGASVALDGTASTANDSDTLTYSWSFLSRPNGSAAVIAGGDTPTPSFVADMQGLYTVVLTVSDGESERTDRVLVLADTYSTLCAFDNVDGLPESGSVTINPNDMLIPLCNGWVFLGDWTMDRIVLMNAITGNVVKTFQLTAPTDMAIDFENNFLFVSQSWSTSITRINLTTGEMTDIPVSGVARSIAIGNDGYVFVATPYLSPTEWSTSNVSVIDGLKGREINTLSDTGLGGFLGYDRLGNRLIVGCGYWDVMFTYSFSPADSSFKLLQKNGDDGRCWNLAVSPDGKHIALSANYTIYASFDSVKDFSSDDIYNVLGAWNTGMDSASVAFSPDGKYLLANNRRDLQVFDVQTHAKLKTFSAIANSSRTLVKVGFSRGGKIVYGISLSENYTDNKLHWAVFNP